MSMGSNVLVLGCVAVMCSCVSSPSTTHQRWSQRDSSIEVRLAAAKTLIKPGDSFGHVDMENREPWQEPTAQLAHK